MAKFAPPFRDAHFAAVKHGMAKTRLDFPALDG